MNKKQFRAILDLLMCADPWPVLGEEGAEGQKILEDWANEQARMFGHEGWVDAFHQLTEVENKEKP